MSPPIRVTDSAHLWWGISAILAMILASCDPADGSGGGQLVEPRSTCDYVPAPRWVLRDNDGNRVQAFVEPRCGRNSEAPSQRDCLHVDPASSSNFPCVRVFDHAGSYINLQYDLATGGLESCHGNMSTKIDLTKNVRDVIISGYFLDEKCDTTPYLPGYGEIGEGGTDSIRLFFAEGKAWHTSGEGCIGGIGIETKVWVWDIESKLCKGKTSTSPLCPVKPIPDWVLNLLPNPPYTMAVEYE